MKKRVMIPLSWALMALMIALVGLAWAEEETVTPNRVTAALEQAARAAAPYEAALERFLDAEDAAWEKAEERGQELEAALKAVRDHTTFVLTGDTSLEEIGPLNGSASRIFTIDLNGYVLYAPTFGTGSYVLKNGTAVDVMAENEEGTLRITVEADACVLADRNPASMDFMDGGDLALVNRGLINGFRRLLYQSARSNRMTIQNDGTIYSDGVAFSSRAFHQNSRVNLTNNGTLVGLVRGLDYHCAGGSLVADGKGMILGAAGLDLEFPKITVSCAVTADDQGLTEEQQAAVQKRLNPYGDKDAPTGIVLDLQSNQADFWITWKVTGRLYASRQILRVMFPRNGQMKGDFSPVIAEDSPARTALLTTELEGARNELTGKAAQNNVESLLKTFKLDGFCANGGEIRITALSRYAEADGKAHIRYSVADSLWSRIQGVRAGKTYTWGVAENGTLEAQEPVQALNAFYQLKAAIALAGKDGVVVLDQDVTLPEGDDAIPLPQGIEIRGDGHRLDGVLRFTVNQQATLTDLEVSGSPLEMQSGTKVDTLLTLRRGHYETLKLNNIIVSSEGAALDNLEMIMWGGRAEYRAPVGHQLRLISTERISGAFRFLMDIAPDAPEDAAVDITLMKGNQSKTFVFEGTTGAESVTVQVLNDRDPSKAFQPTGSNLAETYAVYLRVINLTGLKRPDGSRPPLVFRDENGKALHSFVQGDDGKWTMVD